MQLEIKFKSIAVRWFVNIFLIVAAIVLAAATALSVLFNAIYLDRIKVLLSDYAYEFSALSSANAETLRDSAITIAGEFQYKNKIEVQVMDSNDNVIVSTTGFAPQDSKMPDYEKAKQTGKTEILRSRTADGERVLAGTTVIVNSEGKKIGAYRFVTSLQAYEKINRNFIFLMIIVSLLILALTAFSGLFFIKSIVRPIRDVSNMARKIAMGDFASRIEIDKNDEIGELCDTINYMATELSQAENLKNDFISSVSHELRTPLTAIRGWGETAKMSVGTDDELVTRGLDVVLSESDRLSGLVEELLDFSRIQTGRMILVSKPLDVAALLSESVDMYVELAKQNGIELVFTRPKNETQVMGDINRLKQVFINIIDNAVKYTESGGQVLVNQVTEDGCIHIIVRDTGVGIPAQDIDRVKEKFYKANKTVRGSGIGLAVADEIIKQHEGLLFIDSIEGVGTTVTIVLPIYLPPEEPETEETDTLPQEDTVTLEDIPFEIDAENEKENDNG